MKYQHNVDYMMVKGRLHIAFRFFKTPTEFHHIYCPLEIGKKHVCQEWFEHHIYFPFEICRRDDSIFF